ncbi:MAG: hypothetical protein EDS66_13305 [Planctomycetota bacterium]|nr:MAG: hypothetical protein EDS66_13305 [Planctomycetota bacterium]MCQ3922307.1 hypothetical protein [Planctomycetota bacterium]
MCAKTPEKKLLSAHPATNTHAARCVRAARGASVNTVALAARVGAPRPRRRDRRASIGAVAARGSAHASAGRLPISGGIGPNLRKNFF